MYWSNSPASTRGSMWSDNTVFFNSDWSDTEAPYELRACCWVDVWSYKISCCITQGDTSTFNDNITVSIHCLYRCRCCPRYWNYLLYVYKYTTWLCHRCAPGKISACAPGCCTQLPHRRQNRLFPWRPCSTGCCGTDVPGIRTPTPVSGGNWEQFCQPCPHFCVGLSVAVT